VVEGTMTKTKPCFDRIFHLNYPGFFISVDRLL
jgi:hypothetical protein